MIDTKTRSILSQAPIADAFALAFDRARNILYARSKMADTTQNETVAVLNATDLSQVGTVQIGKSGIDGGR